MQHLLGRKGLMKEKKGKNGSKRLKVDSCDKKATSKPIRTFKSCNWFG
jgi:hypothetical protein